MFTIRLGGDNLFGKWLSTWLSLDVFEGVLFCAVLFYHEMSWMRSGIKLSQFLRNFQSTLAIFSYTAPCVQTMSVNIYFKFKKK